MAKKMILTVALALVVVLALGGVALAATPQDIYNDFADNGKLDGSYSKAELEAYLADATVHQYGDPYNLGVLDTLVKQMLASSTTTTFPFTGLEIALIAFGAVALLGGGLVLRRSAG
ncbi:MAG: hypothetical protein KKA32_13575 [Actinobacteria bacterium]|nr:hypothetical protein [Actinomycetota bacterium]